MVGDWLKEGAPRGLGIGCRSEVSNQEGFCALNTDEGAIQS